MKQEATPTQQRRRATRGSIRVLGAKARRLRQERRLTREDLSDRAGISPNYIGQVELGHRDPCLSTVKALASGLDTTVSDLFGATRTLSKKAIEMAKLFSEAPEVVQGALLGVLRAAVRKAEGTK